MKNIYLIAIVFVAYCSVINAKDSDDFDIKDTYKKHESCENEWRRKVPKECPDVDPLNTTVHLAHETDCEKFYKCLGGEPIIQDCPPRNNKGDKLHFNERCQVCDWPAAAKCHHDTDPDPGSSVSTPKSSDEWEDCSNEEDGTLLPHECSERCWLFYLCRDGDKIEQKCPKDTYFSRHYKGCVPKADSDCPGKEDCDDKCKEDGDKIRHECECEHYYECEEDDKADDGFRKILQTCDNGQHFNCKEKECQDPKDAGCDENPHPHPHPGKCPEGKEEGDEWSYVCDCRLYYKCVKGVKKIHECPWGKWFDEEKKKCRPKEKVDCDCECDECKDEDSVFA